MRILIDANDLKWKLSETADKYDSDYLFFDVIADEIDNAPTVDAVEVVRCKDCKHRGSDMCPMETVELYPWFGTKNDAFCSYGGRRNET